MCDAVGILPIDQWGHRNDVLRIIVFDGPKIAELALTRSLIGDNVGGLHIETNGQHLTDITIHNTMGVRVRPEQINGDSNHMTLDLSTLPAGVYYMTVKSGETTTRYKVVKTK